MINNDGLCGVRPFLRHTWLKKSRSKTSKSDTMDRKLRLDRQSWLAIGVTLLLAVSLLFLFRNALAFMVEWWTIKEEYNHGFLIPVVAFYLLWLRAKRVGELEFAGAPLGFLFLLVSLLALGAGELSGIATVLQYSFLLALFSVVLMTLGWKGMRVLWVPLIYLIFMIPLPNFLYFNLSEELQLISSQLGVAVIRFFGISVYLEGNVIDLGIYQLQVAEACNGLRYLFPLMSFGFLCASLYIGPWWHRLIIFLSTIPITVLMNSFRIGVIGVLVENFGIEQAEGFLHYFEGWIVFMACLGILFLVMYGLNALFGQKRFVEVFALDVPPADDLVNLIPRKATPGLIACAVVLFSASLASVLTPSRPELIPEREPLSTFPLAIGDWRGREQYVEQVFLDTLKLDDHLMVNFADPVRGQMTNLWIAYYDTQKTGASTHSPRRCLPGGGWVMKEFGQIVLNDVRADGSPLRVNRALITQGKAKQLVYYWFIERGRPMTNEYLVRFSILWDAVVKNRSDGALVRVVTAVPNDAELEEVEARVQDFVRAIDPQLNYYLPQGDAVLVEAGARGGGPDLSRISK